MWYNRNIKKLLGLMLLVSMLLVDSVFFLSRGSAAGTTRNVPAEYPTIQAAIDASTSGDTVLVAPGTYSGSATIHVNKVITLASLYHTTGLESYIDQTIITSSAATVLDVTSAGAGALVTGFTIKGPDKGIQVLAKADVTHNSFPDSGGDNLSWEDGGAGKFAYNRFVNCGDDCIDSDNDSNGVAGGDRVIEYNTMNGANDDCIEIRLQGYTGTQMNYYVRNNIIENCTDDGVQLIDYAGASSRRFYIYRNLIRSSGTSGVGATAGGSTSQTGAGSPLVEPVQIYNNTIIGQKWGVVGGTNMLVVNNIIKGTTLYALRMLQDMSWAAYNDLYQNAANADATSEPRVGEGMLYTDPKLDASYRLSTGSPAIDAGVAHYEKNGQVMDVTDFTGSAPDMGAYEYGGDSTPTNQTPSVSAGPDIETYHLTNTATLDGTVTDDGKPSGVLNITWSKTEGPGTVTFSSPNAADTNATLSKQGTYKLKLEASDGALTSADSVVVKYVQAGSGAKTDVAAPGTTYFEAEAYSWLYAPASLIDDAVASGGKAILAPNEQGTESRTEYTLSLRQEGYSYYVWVRMSGPDASGDSVAVSFNDSTERIISTIADGAYHWQKMNGNFPSPAGEYPFIVRAAEDGVRWDRIIFTTDANFTPDAPSAALVAFPGAEGFGAYALGGRGGRVYEVTNLNDSGTGSLRACVAASGPRICVFRTGGTINLVSTLVLLNPYITIAGQTAPGGGIAIRGYDFDIKTHDVVIRHLRVRTGDEHGSSEPDGIAIKPSGSDTHPTRNVIVDHSSVSWGVDETFSFWSGYGLPASQGGWVKDVTVQWSIVSEGLRNAGHSQGSHSMGLLVGDHIQNLSLHHNLFAHNDKRNPEIKGNSRTEVINNVMYDWGTDGIRIYNSHPETAGQWTNIIANYGIPGPSTTSGCNRRLVYMSNVVNQPQIYVAGNIDAYRTNDGQAQDLAVCNLTNWDLATTPIAAIDSGISRHTAVAAKDLVLAQAGATVPARDVADERVVNSVKNGTGSIIDSQNQVGGWPTLAAGTPPMDTDHDGMPNDWETARGLNPNFDDSAGDRNGDGYTNIEEYMNGLVGGGIPPDTTPPTVPTNLRVVSVTALRSVLQFLGNILQAIGDIFGRLLGR